MVITALVETESRDQLEEWVDAFGITFPVGGDYDRSVFKTYKVKNSRPQYAIVTRDFTVDLVTTVHSEAEARVLELLAE